MEQHFLDVCKARRWNLTSSTIGRPFTATEEAYKFAGNEDRRGDSRHWCKAWFMVHEDIIPTSLGDQPAKIFLDGHLEWFLEDRLHRDPKDGPAVITKDGDELYFLHGAEVDSNGVLKAGEVKPEAMPYCTCPICPKVACVACGMG